jgi:hypothetical protein
MKQAKDQKDQNLDFNGQAGTGVNHAGNKYAGNQSGLTFVGNHGMKAAARKGNASDSVAERREFTGPSVTKDKQKQTIATANQGVNIGSGYKCPPVGNPDKINVGSR